MGGGGGFEARVHSRSRLLGVFLFLFKQYCEIIGSCFKFYLFIFALENIYIYVYFSNSAFDIL